MKKLLTTITLSLVLTAVLASCGTSKTAEEEIFIAAEWNLQALFDGEDDGTEYGEYRDSSQWTREKYSARLTAISQAVLKMTGEDGASKSAAPDLIGFIEVENGGILEDLAGGILSKNGYFWTAFATLPGSALGIGFISRYPILEARAHSITVEKATAPRPVLEVRVEPGGKPLVFLLCHWKSKLGGDRATEDLRRASARVVQRRLREIRASEGGTPVIVMGDLNENHDEFYRQSYICALLPDDPGAAAMACDTPEFFAGPATAIIAHNAPSKSTGLAAAEGSGRLSSFLVLSREKPPQASCFPQDVPALYSPWYEEANEGSYLFREKWETIDHFLLSEALFDGYGWEYSGFRVLNHPPFISSGGGPDSYNPKSGRGLSDHLPLLLYLEVPLAAGAALHD